MKLLYAVITYKRPMMLLNTIKSIQHEAFLWSTREYMPEHGIEIIVIDDCEAEALESVGAQRILGGTGIKIIQPGDEVGRRGGPVKCHERLGGLLRYYYRDAA